MSGEPKLLREILTEVADMQGMSRLHELLAGSHDARRTEVLCARCSGTGEVGVRRELETNEWVTVDCPVCGGSGEQNDTPLTVAEEEQARPRTTEGIEDLEVNLVRLQDKAAANGWLGGVA